MRYVVIVCLFVWCGLAEACAQTVQEQIEKTIGALTVQNMVCAGQSMAQAEELRRVRAELDAAKAKQPVEAK